MRSKLDYIGWIVLWLMCMGNHAFAQQRTDLSLDQGWKTIENDTSQTAYTGFEAPAYNDHSWITVAVPHNWDEYGGYRRLLHGNRHGYAWYRKTFTLGALEKDRRCFLYFEGVGSYATVWVNGKKVGHHAGGRTTFTIDVTDALLTGRNVVAVRADHPAGIEDLPWVCGGCSPERGFSEGSQPMGIFRPVHLVVTRDLRIEPFGVHIWNDTTVSRLFLETTLRNYSNRPRTLMLVSRLTGGGSVTTTVTIPAGQVFEEKQALPLYSPHLWSLKDPYLYTLVSEIIENGVVTDKVTTPYGIRWIKWDGHRFLLNGHPVFINGIAEYEHALGHSHALTAEEIGSRARMIRDGGFNAFRDAHQPHNLRYQEYWDQWGMLWWPQFSAHIWFDSPAFRENFKTLLADWIRERRNSPSVILWGLQNESKLPADFARECVDLIRKLDPTASSQREITTCNGGEGTDWDVPQNWTGTYGGNPNTYAEDLRKQVLVGEYGAWRTADLHAEDATGYSEEHMEAILETKLRAADSIQAEVATGDTSKRSAAGHFFWLYASHDNPGRVQGGEGYRDLDRIGPVNYKGLLTEWGEPLDAYYMFQAHYAREPMVYIVSHTWPDRWMTPGRKSGIVVYSNCDEVELFNDVNACSLGRRSRPVGGHFQWDSVDIRYNVLYAVGYVRGRVVARDSVVLRHLPEAPHFGALYGADAPGVNTPMIVAPGVNAPVIVRPAPAIVASAPGFHYWYRVHCGGPAYTDTRGDTWMADRALAGDSTWGSSSWTNDYPGMPAFFASQRRISDPIKGTRDWPLFQTFRYGRDKLSYTFPLPDGDYRVELYFMEPWIGERVFDVVVNGHTVLKDLDIAKEVGMHAALKKVVTAHITGGRLVISFPRVLVGQAVISAIAIASTTPVGQVASSKSVFQQFQGSNSWTIEDWLDAGDREYSDTTVTFGILPPALYGAQWLRGPIHPKDPARFVLGEDADVYTSLDKKERLAKGAVITARGDVFVCPVTSLAPAYDLKPVTGYKVDSASGGQRGVVYGKSSIRLSASDTVHWKVAVGVADMYSLTLRYADTTGSKKTLLMEIIDASGTVLKKENLSFAVTPSGKWGYVTTDTGGMINAGYYTIRLTATDADGLVLSGLDVQ